MTRFSSAVQKMNGFYHVDDPAMLDQELIKRRSEDDRKKEENEEVKDSDKETRETKVSSKIDEVQDISN